MLSKTEVMRSHPLSVVIEGFKMMVYDAVVSHSAGQSDSVEGGNCDKNQSHAGKNGLFITAL